MGDKDMCVADVNVKVWLDHSCTSDVMHRESLSRQHSAGSRHNENDPAYAEDPPLARDAAVVLFDSHDGTLAGCGVNLEGIVFDDQADESVDGGSFSPFKGAFRPLAPLSAFNGLQASGEWSLLVYDKVRNNLEGVLKKWEIRFELRACEARYAWRELTKLTTGEKPKARYAHSTLVIDRSMFLWGGHAWERKSDLWRLDIDDLKWTKLDSSSHVTRTLAVPSEKYGRALVITPWSILAFGGYAHTSFEPLVWRYDPFYMQWSQ